MATGKELLLTLANLEPKALNLTVELEGCDCAGDASGQVIVRCDILSCGYHPDVDYCLREHPHAVRLLLTRSND